MGFEKVTDLTRREFCNAGAIAAALSATCGVPNMAVARPSPVNPVLILVDTRYPASEVLACLWQRETGGEICRFLDDVTPLWLGKLHGRWDRKSPPVGGLTSAQTLFCLERMAWDAGQRVLHRNNAGNEESGFLVRWLIGPKRLHLTAAGARA